MSDPRAANVERWRAQLGAERLFILTAVTPFTVSQARFAVVDAAGGARLISCRDCTPRSPLDIGESEPILPAVLRQFLDDLAAAADAWAEDAVPANVHDGITLTMERADAAGYARVRMVDPPPDSPHARLLAAWTRGFPAVRRALG